ncbi:MAG: YbaK/EbsC family protein [Candidatus Bathyarchaeota archaeon]|jgi:Cys-tRNA(Pro) deacylase
MSREKLEAYIRENKIDAKILVFDKTTKTVEDAEKRLGINRERIIKSMLFVDERGIPMLAIVSGDRKVSEEKLGRVCGVSKVRVARPRAVKSLTGYEAGALPPIGHKKRIRTFIDPKVLSFERVYGGGGAINALLEIDPQDVTMLTNAEVIDVSEG